MKRIKMFLGLGLVSLLLTGCNFGSPDKNGSREQLSTPTNIKYDEATGVLTWDAVKNVREYELEIWDAWRNLSCTKYINLNTNKYECVPPYLVTKIKIRATNTVDYHMYYPSSEWSDTFVYKYPTNVLSINNIEAFFRSYLGSCNYDLTRIVSFCPKEDTLTYNAVFDDNKIHKISILYDEEINSLKELFNINYGADDYHFSEYDIKNYDSISYYLQSDSYKNKLETYRQDGYSFEPITSQSYEIDDATIGIDSILKLEKEDDVKYFATTLSFYVSSDLSERAKFTTELINIIDRYVFLDAFVELEGDFVEAANLLATTQPNF